MFTINVEGLASFTYMPSLVMYTYIPILYIAMYMPMQRHCLLHGDLVLHTFCELDLRMYICRAGASTVIT